jgi:hypothetical protein
MMNIREKKSILFSPILTKEPSPPCSFSTSLPNFPNLASLKESEVEGERELL